MFTPFWRRVQALGDPPTPLPAPKTAASGTEPCQRQHRRLAALSRRRPDWAGGLRETLDARRSYRRRRGSRHFSKTASPAMPAIATGPTATARRGCRRICASARSARGRSGTPRALPRPSALRLAGDIDKFLSELGWREFCRHLLFDVPDLADAQSATAVRRLSLEARRQGTARVAARPDRLSHRRCRHARALAHRRDAQPRADGGGVVPGQASPDRLARGRDNGSGTRWSMPMPAAIPPTGNGSPAPAPMPRPISACSIRSCRARSSIPTASMSGAGCRSWRNCRTSLIHQPWSATPLELASAGVELGKTYPQPDHRSQGRPRTRARGLCEHPQRD